MSDRAAVVAPALIQIFTAALRRWHSDGDLAALAAVRAEVTAYLRDEIHDIERTVRDEIRPDDRDGC